MPITVNTKILSEKFLLNILRFIKIEREYSDERKIEP